MKPKCLHVHFHIQLPESTQTHTVTINLVGACDEEAIAKVVRRDLQAAAPHIAAASARTVREDNARSPRSKRG